VSDTFDRWRDQNMITKQLNRIFARAMYGMVIAAMVFSVTGKVNAQDYNPWFTVFPEQGVVEGWDWPLGETVKMTIYDPNTSSSYSKNGVVTDSEGSNWVWIDFSGEYSTKPGDVVTLSLLDDGTMEQVHVVQNLAITEINPDENWVFGTTNEGKVVTLWSWEDTEGRRIETDGSENWGVDFDDLDNGGFDLEPGFHVRAEVWDDNGNDTAVDWEVPESPPNPFIAVSLTERWFWANNFTPEAPVTFYIYDDKDDANTIFEFSRNTDESGNVTIEGWEHGWLPEPGDYIVATDGSIVKDLELEYITLDVFDPGNDFLSGIAAYPERSVDIGVGNENGEQWMNVTADNNSQWVADFTLPGYEFDITEDMWAGAHVNDEDGDVTAAHNSGPVFVFPGFQDEVFVTSEDEIILGIGWGACTPGLVTAWLQTADYHWYMDGNPILSSEQAAHYWSPVESRGSNPACLIGAGNLWVASWRYSIESLPVGDHEVSLIYGTDHKLTDGGDSDGDGQLDFYQQLEANVTIHVIEP